MIQLSSPLTEAERKFYWTAQSRGLLDCDIVKLITWQRNGAINLDGLFDDAGQDA